MKLILLFFVAIGLAQSKQSFYFDFNQSSFNTTQEEAFQTWMQANATIEVIKVEGYCDYVGTNVYNKQLATKRIVYVLSKLKANKQLAENLITTSFGEDFKQDSIQDANRRVDIYFREANQNLETFFTSNSSGKAIVLKNLNFYNNSGKVVPNSIPVLKELLTIMIKNPKLKIDIQGHICCQTIEEAEKIEDIANVRALAIYTYLINNGIEKERLSYQSFKSTKPLFPIPEKNEDERNANRRVEIMIVEN